MHFRAFLLVVGFLGLFAGSAAQASGDPIRVRFRTLSECERDALNPFDAAVEQMTKLTDAGFRSVAGTKFFSQSAFTVKLSETGTLRVYTNFFANSEWIVPNIRAVAFEGTRYGVSMLAVHEVAQTGNEPNYSVVVAGTTYGSWENLPPVSDLVRVPLEEQLRRAGFQQDSGSPKVFRLVHSGSLLEIVVIVDKGKVVKVLKTLPEQYQERLGGNVVLEGLTDIPHPHNSALRLSQLRVSSGRHRWNIDGLGQVTRAGEETSVSLPRAQLFSLEAAYAQLPASILGFHPEFSNSRVFLSLDWDTTPTNLPHPSRDKDYSTSLMSWPAGKWSVSLSSRGELEINVFFRHGADGSAIEAAIRGAAQGLVDGVVESNPQNPSLTIKNIKLSASHPGQGDWGQFIDRVYGILHATQSEAAAKATDSATENATAQALVDPAVVNTVIQGNSSFGASLFRTLAAGALQEGEEGTSRSLRSASLLS